MLEGSGVERDLSSDASTSAQFCNSVSTISSFANESLQHYKPRAISSSHFVTKKATQKKNIILNESHALRYSIIILAVVSRKNLRSSILVNELV